jgi:two-component system KDP operon response regulator KdpE
LIVDDDPALVRLLERAFVKAGAEVYTAEDGQAGLEQFFAHQPDLVILDILMPVLDGWETCARMKLFSDVPIILLTSLGEERDVIRGLESCAADYVTKPFSVKLLLARAVAVLREAEAASDRERAAAYDNGYLRLDLEARQVQVRGQPVKLTNTEYRLLAYLYRNAGCVVTYEQILAAVWGREYRDATSYVHNYISRLRQKLERDPKNPEYVLTEHGVGCKFQKPGSP